MASNGIPIRLSAALATSAREAASIEDRSMTEQIEHWARLGQSVEGVVKTKTVRQLKTVSHDEHLPALLAYADTPVANVEAAALIRTRNPVRYGAAGPGVVRIDQAGRTAGRVVDGKFAPRRPRR